MHDYGEDDEFFDNEAEVSMPIDDEAEEEDPRGAAFMRGVEEAVQIREESEDEEEEF